MKNQKKTISIGISVYNEASTIENLIMSIVRQDQTDFTLERIYVICDGTNDGTEKIVKKLAQKYSVIHLMNDGKRKGKVERMKEIFQLNLSDIIMILDGDVVLSSQDVLYKVVKCFENNEVALVSANNQPVKADTLIGKIINYDIYIWYLVRSRHNNGDNIFNIRGCCIALSKKFASNLNFPTQIHSYGRYLYLLCQQKKLRFVFAKKAIILYRKPTNISDYISQSRRMVSDRSILQEIFGNRSREIFKIPIKYKLLAVLEAIFQNPILFMSSFALKFFVKKIPISKLNSKNTVFWGMVKSTKKPIPIPF